ARFARAHPARLPPALGRGLAAPRRRAPAARGGAFAVGAMAPLAGLWRLSLAGRGEALRQRVHQVDHLAPRLLLGGLGDDLLPFRLALEKREDLLAEGVLVLLGIEVRRQRLHELLGHLQLLLTRL